MQRIAFSSLIAAGVIFVLFCILMLMTAGCQATQDGLETLATGQTSAERAWNRELASKIQQTVEGLEKLRAERKLTPEEEAYLAKYKPVANRSAEILETWGLGDLVDELLIASGVGILALVGRVRQVNAQKRREANANKEIVRGIEVFKKNAKNGEAEELKKALDNTQSLETTKIVAEKKAEIKGNSL